jgi:hypothetical protein
MQLCCDASRQGAAAGAAPRLKPYQCLICMILYLPNDVIWYNVV